MRHKALTQMESALRSLVLWEGWTDKDRQQLRTIADQIAVLAKRYLTREKELKKGNRL